MRHKLIPGALGRHYREVQIIRFADMRTPNG
jgi:hypothetical protein